MREALEVFSQGIEVHPEYAPLYRHRGHRYISLRQFGQAITDLEKAVALMGDVADAIEQDGMPNERNIPLTTTGFNVWYHLALARYLTGDFEGALDGYRKTMECTRGFDDNVVAVSDWMYMTLRRMGRDDEAAAVLERITPEMEIIENDAYHRRLLMYKGEIEPGELLNLEDATELDIATLGYGLGNWYLCNGDEVRATEVFERVVSGPYWPAFGFIAAEVDLARLRAGSEN
jgi:tetratricopeptide (TPR) repeat protein